MDNNHQLSRYGAISKSHPFATGKTFFLVNSTEFALQEFQNRYPVDSDGVTRVYTTWAAVITSLQANTDADVVMVSPLFTTAPTAAQLAQLDAAGVVVYQMGSALLDGTYMAVKTASAIATTTNYNLFQVNGRIELLDIIGEVVTSTGATVAAKFQFVGPTATTTDLTATTNIAAMPAGSMLTITGTLTNLMKTTLDVIARQATPLIISGGTLALNISQTTTGNIAYKVRYKPLDNGAFVSSL